MASEVLMPRQGNTVESCVILSWEKAEGDTVRQGEVLCEVETDKATFEVEAPVEGTLLKILYPEGADVPVLELIAVIGEKAEDVNALLEKRRSAERSEEKSAEASSGGVPAVQAAPSISPRARNLADAKGVDYARLSGSGPGGRIIERDIRAALGGSPEATPAALAALKAAGGVVPSEGTEGTGLGGRITAGDVAAKSAMDHAGPAASGGLAASRGAFPGPTKEIPVQGIRRRVAERMLASLQTTAQVTLFMSADATAIRSYRARLKASRPDLSSVNVNDMILYAVSRTLLAYPEMNAYFERSKILQFERVHLGFAVDTPRGLMVPVIRHADQLSLREISMEAKRLAASCVEGKISSGELSGGTFTVSNLGTVGIEYFTPVLYSPQVGIVGVGNITLRPVEADGKYEFVPHLPLSLTVDHQAVDGAPAARFLQSLAANLATFDLLLAE